VYILDRRVYIGVRFSGETVVCFFSSHNFTSETVSILVFCRVPNLSSDAGLPVKFLGKLYVVRRLRDVHFSLQSQLKFLFELGPCRETMKTTVSILIIVYYKLLHVINSTLCLKAHVISSSRIQYRGMLY
jgi:hypothetical protein